MEVNLYLAMNAFRRGGDEGMSVTATARFAGRGYRLRNSEHEISAFRFLRLIMTVANKKRTFDMLSCYMGDERLQRRPIVIVGWATGGRSGWIECRGRVLGEPAQALPRWLSFRTSLVQVLAPGLKRLESQEKSLVHLASLP